MNPRIASVLCICGVVSLSSGAVLRVGSGRTYTALQQVVNLLNPGDTVLVDGDQTYTGGVTFSRAGQATAPIVILGVRVNGNRPILSGGTNTVAFTTQNADGSGADHYVF